MNILLLEDDLLQRETIKEMLKDYKCEFFEAETPDAAWKIVKREKIQCAIIDMYLEDDSKNGLAFMTQLRDKPILRNIPTVMISASPDRMAIETANGVRCDAFLMKPLKEERLVEVLKKTGRLRRSGVSGFASTDELPKGPSSPFRVESDVLLVDNDPSRAERLREQLKNTLWTVDVMPHYKSAAAVLDKEPSKIVFININHQDSWEERIDLCVELQGRDDLASSRIVALASTADSDILLAAKDKGVEHFILDGFSKEKLLKAGDFLMEQASVGECAD